VKIRDEWTPPQQIDSSGLVGLGVIGFEVPEIDSSGLVGLAVIGFEVPEIDSSGLVGLAVIGFEVLEIDSSGLVGFEVLGTSSARPTAANLFPSRSISSTLTFSWSVPGPSSGASVPCQKP